MVYFINRRSRLFQIIHLPAQLKVHHIGKHPLGLLICKHVISFLQRDFFLMKIFKCKKLCSDNRHIGSI